MDPHPARPDAPPAPSAPGPGASTIDVPTSQPVDAPALSAARLTKRYRGGAGALRDVGLAIPAGSVTALVGPNGAGKSTLIRTWVGFEPPTGGGVAVLGIDPWRHRGEAIARLGYVPQAASLYRDLSVADHLALAGTLRRGFDRVGAAARLDDLGIPLRMRAGHLSGGQQAQVGLALALGTRAQVLLLDEPLASLDPLARREFLAVLLAAVRTTGATALLSSHIVADVAQACDRLIVLGDGRVRLHAAISDALAVHRTSPPDDRGLPPGADVVAVFPAEDGRPRWLVRLGATGTIPADPVGSMPASLEEVVLGYLAAGRSGAATKGWAA
jgi:ABC-2 type transport system ATP-binding protein